MSIMEIERGKVAWAEQSAVGDAAQAQIRLFMRTGPFASKNPVAIADQQQIDILQPEAEDGSMLQPVQTTDRYPIFVPGYHRHNAGGSQIATRIGVGLKPLHGLLTWGQFDMTKSTSISAVIST
jgi:hypothetical protein